MKKSIALSMTALALIGLTACTDIRIAEDPQAEVTLPAQTPVAEAPAEETEPPTPESNEDVEATGDDTSGIDEMLDGAKESASAAVGKTINLGLPPDEGTMYLLANLAFNPWLDRWVVNGDEIHYQRYNCVGKMTEEAYGVMSKAGTSDNMFDVEFDSLAPETLMGGSNWAQLEITERKLTTPHNVSEPSAITNTELAVNEFTELCGDTAETVASFVF